MNVRAEELERWPQAGGKELLAGRLAGRRFRRHTLEAGDLIFARAPARRRTLKLDLIGCLTARLFYASGSRRCCRNDFNQN